MATIEITLQINDDQLSSYSDTHLATLWHVAQANPAPHGDHTAGELVERIGREIIRRWLRNTPPELWHHQGRHYYWSELGKIAKYRADPGKPGSTEWHSGEWVPTAGQDPDARTHGEHPRAVA